MQSILMNINYTQNGTWTIFRPLLDLVARLERSSLNFTTRIWFTATYEIQTLSWRTTAAYIMYCIMLEILACNHRQSKTSAITLIVFRKFCLQYVISTNPCDGDGANDHCVWVKIFKVQYEYFSIKS